MTPSPFARRFAATAAVLLALAALSGCGRNRPGTLMAPTGIRPSTGASPGSITGVVLFDPRNAPDLDTGPFPPTRVELYSDTALVAVDSLTAFSQTYLFEHVRPGPYSIVVRSRAFLPNSRGGLYVRQDPIDAGDITLTIDPGAFSSSMDLIGTIPGYTFDQFGSGTTTFLENSLGIWTLSQTDFLFIPPAPIPAGTYRFKFVTSYASTDGNLIGWGGNLAETIVAPVTDHPSVMGTGPATDLVVRFPSTTTYAFTFDERRQVFSIQVGAAPSSPFARR